MNFYKYNKLLKIPIFNDSKNYLKFYRFAVKNKFSFSKNFKNALPVLSTNSLNKNNSQIINNSTSLDFLTKKDPSFKAYYNWSNLFSFFFNLEKNNNEKIEINAYAQNLPLFYPQFKKQHIEQSAFTDEKRKEFSQVKFLSNYINQNSCNSIGLNFLKLNDCNNYIVLDIDNREVGERLIKLSQIKSTSFSKVFGNPLIIKTETFGHLHLYYKSNNEILTFENRKKNKIKHCTRLGFPAEYIFGNITFASQKRHIIRGPSNLNCISELPPTLYPYNYYPNPEFFSLINGIPYNPNSYPNSKFIPEGRRNEFLYHFFKYDNFYFCQVLTTNYLLCNPPIDNQNELSDSCVNRRFKDKRSDSDQPSFKFFKGELFPNQVKEFYRLRINDDYPKMNYDSVQKKKLLNRNIINSLALYNFNPDRIIQALYQQTPENTLILIGYLEKENDFFFEDSQWLGKSSEFVLLYYFLKNNNYEKFILYINQEESWYLWEKTHWKLSSIKFIDNLFFKFLNEKVPFAGSEFRFFKSNHAIRNIMLNFVTLESWPTDKNRGINFQNGVLLAKEENKETYLERHKPKFYHRSCLPCDYIKNASLTPIQIRFILDICSENNWNINVFRYILLLIICPHLAQVGVFLNSQSGGSKSTFVRLIRKIFPDGVLSLSLKDIKEGNSFLGDYTAGSQVLIINDASPQNLKHSGINDYIKQYLGKDTQSAQKKYKNFYQSKSTGFFIIVSNYSILEISLFYDNAIVDRLINFTTPVIKDGFKVIDLEEILMQNLSGLINWVLHCSYEYLDQFIRVGHLNKVYSLENQQSLMTQFIQNYLVFVSDTGKGSTVLLPNSDIIENFKTFQLQYEEKEISFKTNERILKEFDLTINNLIPNQKKNIRKGRRSKFRGYYGVALKSRLLSEIKKGKEKQNNYFDFNQILDLEEIKFEKNKTIINLLDKNSFSYNGVLTSTVNNPKFIFTKGSFPQIEKDCYHLISLVQSYSCCDLIKFFPFHAEPFNIKHIPLLETGSYASDESRYESALELTDLPQGPVIYSSTFYQQMQFPVPLLQLQLSPKQTPLLIGSSSNPIDFLMQEIKKTQFSIGFKNENKINFLLYFVDNLSYHTIKFDDNLYTEKSPEKQLQKLLVNSLIDIIIKTTKKFPSFKEMCYIFYYSYSSVLLREELLLNIFKPNELTFYVYEVYPSYRNEINQWDKNEFLKLFNKLYTDSDFLKMLEPENLYAMCIGGFIPCSEESNIPPDFSTAVNCEFKEIIKQNKDKISYSYSVQQNLKTELNSGDSKSLNIISSKKKRGRPSKKK